MRARGGCQHISNPFYQLRRNAAHYGIWLDVFCYNRSGGHDRPIADGHPREDGGVRPDPDVPADMDRLGDHVEPVQRVELMVERGQDDLMADQCPVADVDPALILKAAIRVDEDVCRSRPDPESSNTS